MQHRGCPSLSRCHRGPALHPQPQRGPRRQLMGAGHFPPSSPRSHFRNQAVLHTRSSVTGTAPSSGRPPRSPPTAHPAQRAGLRSRLHVTAFPLPASVADVQQARAPTPPQPTPKQAGAERGQIGRRAGRA
ncbi:hypothetical protein NDU88_001411 [Pleurodeles waltl]|uniref:Uncharacterized protein n=1 Tax=Pleurodeles waltl TaxID=8319 RepID=A0AAV7NCC5_PLEWA|nr:hypothetical protein NDU88_001411 [Pleurodeles waltl]